MQFDYVPASIYLRGVEDCYSSPVELPLACDLCDPVAFRSESPSSGTPTSSSTSSSISSSSASSDSSVISISILPVACLSVSSVTTTVTLKVPGSSKECVTVRPLLSSPSSKSQR